ncbi:glutathione S-transferase family protein [Nitrospirillum sp. BR 11828]|uniref:glutathione S-transferase family protein n=1 Tax=Nitrospirillum sp. BR 11828 TaxID=3104325 RepID=UPI002ACA806A|nr:glutathione S-transferase family protein [Nitrospirillum sp. BR 11828]MDZ5646515.1 glutathione S-transferase family protein [Nitrospirillum sp. BR 11828]
MGQPTSADLTLILGSKTYSSWSLRPYLALRHAGLAFEEVVIPLRQPDSKARMLAHNPAGKVPALIHRTADGPVTVWDSLAICEYAAELAPGAALWPEDRAARAHARSVSAEMHAGFMDLRRNLFMDLARTIDRPERVARAAGDIARVQALWADCLDRYGGPFLFGAFTIADAMYAPVVTRFQTWRVPLTEKSQAYAAAIEALPAMKDWRAAAATETLVLDMLLD